MDHMDSRDPLFMDMYFTSADPGSIMDLLEPGFTVQRCALSTAAAIDTP
jgi:hypothetical protein